MKIPESFSFKPITEAEKRNEKELREIQEATQLIIDRAKACLNSDLFKKYREEYAWQERIIIDNFISLNIADPIEYACICRTIAGKLSAIRELLKMVEKDAK